MATRIAPSIYEERIGNRTFEIDGQNGIEYGTREWQVFETTNGARIWCETYPTKRDALSDIPRLVTI